MDTRNDVSDDGDEAVLALRRTLWQLAVAGVAAACAVERFAPESQVVALWCALAPACALAMHFRQAIVRRLLQAFHGDESTRDLVDAHRNRSVRPRRLSPRPSRKAAMALRRGPARVRVATR